MAALVIIIPGEFSRFMAVLIPGIHLVSSPSVRACSSIILGYYGDNHGKEVVSILMNGTSHCSDMTGSGNPVEIKKALDQVESYLDKWLH